MALTFGVVLECYGLLLFLQPMELLLKFLELNILRPCLELFFLVIKLVLFRCLSWWILLMTSSVIMIMLGIYQYYYQSLQV